MQNHAVKTTGLMVQMVVGAKTLKKTLSVVYLKRKKEPNKMVAQSHMLSG